MTCLCLLPMPEGELLSAAASKSAACCLVLSVDLVLDMILSLTQYDGAHRIAPDNMILACRIPSNTTVSLNPACLKLAIVPCECMPYEDTVLLHMEPWLDQNQVCSPTAELLTSLSWFLCLYVMSCSCVSSVLDHNLACSPKAA